MPDRLPPAPSRSICSAVAASPRRAPLPVAVCRTICPALMGAAVAVSRTTSRREDSVARAAASIAAPSTTVPWRPPASISTRAPPPCAVTAPSTRTATPLAVAALASVRSAMSPDVADKPCSVSEPSHRLSTRRSPPAWACSVAAATARAGAGRAPDASTEREDTSPPACSTSAPARTRAASRAAASAEADTAGPAGTTRDTGRPRMSVAAVSRTAPVLTMGAVTASAPPATVTSTSAAPAWMPATHRSPPAARSRSATGPAACATLTLRTSVRRSMAPPALSHRSPPASTPALSSIAMPEAATRLTVERAAPSKAPSCRLPAVSKSNVPAPTPACTRRVAAVDRFFTRTSPEPCERRRNSPEVSISATAPAAPVIAPWASMDSRPAPSASGTASPFASRGSRSTLPPAVIDRSMPAAGTPATVTVPPASMDSAASASEVASMRTRPVAAMLSVPPVAAPSWSSSWSSTTRSPETSNGAAPGQRVAVAPTLLGRTNGADAVASTVVFTPRPDAVRTVSVRLVGRGEPTGAFQTRAPGRPRKRARVCASPLRTRRRASVAAWPEGTIVTPAAPTRSRTPALPAGISRMTVSGPTAALATPIGEAPRPIVPSAATVTATGSATRGASWTSGTACGTGKVMSVVRPERAPETGSLSVRLSTRDVLALSAGV